MSLGPLMTGIAGPSLLAQERERLRDPGIGGVILFTRNYESPAQLTRLSGELHDLRTPALLVAVDQEGGPVQRFREGFTRLPPPTRLGARYRRDPEAARRVAEQCGWLMAAELRATGVDLSFAPVLDLDRGVSAVIGERALHRDPEVVAELARCYVRGMQRAGMAAVGKHFPGHGAVTGDSHRTLPVDPRPMADLEQEDLVPFERLIHRSIPAIMAAHVLYPAVDPQPAGFSRHWLHEVLRGRLGFQGAVFSDDLGMAAAGVAGDHPARARAALAAGCDMVLLCNELEAVPVVLRALQGHRDPAAQLRLARLRGARHAPDWARLRASPAWHEAVDALAALDPDPELDLGLE